MHANADAAAGGIVQPQIGQGLPHVVIGLATGHDAKAVLRAFDHVVVELVGTHIGQRRIPLVVHEAGFLLQRRIGPANVQTTLGHHKVFGQHHLHAVRVHIDAAGRLHHLLNRLHARPQAAEAAHGKGMQAHVQYLLHAGRKKHRRAAGLEDVVTLVRCGGRLADVVIPRQRNHPAMLGRARHIGVLEHVRAAVHPWAFAVPDAKHTVELLGLWIQIELLRTPDRRGGQLFVHAGLKDNVLAVQVLLRGPECLVVATQR